MYTIPITLLERHGLKINLAEHGPVLTVPTASDVLGFVYDAEFDELRVYTPAGEWIGLPDRPPAFSTVEQVRARLDQQMYDALLEQIIPNNAAELTDPS